MRSKSVQQKITDYEFNPGGVQDSNDLGQKRPKLDRLKRFRGWFTLKHDRTVRLATWMQKRVSWSKGAEKRGQKAMRILEKPENITCIKPGHYTVKSQSQPGLWYDVIRKSTGRWECNCFDYEYRKARCKHILAVTAHVVDNEAEKIMKNVSETDSKETNVTNRCTTITEYCTKKYDGGDQLPHTESKQEKDTDTQTKSELYGDNGGDQSLHTESKQEKDTDTQTKSELYGDNGGDNGDNEFTDSVEPTHIYPIDEKHPPKCKHCNNTHIIKYGTQEWTVKETGQKKKEQRWQCSKKDGCGAVFVYRAGMERMRCSKKDVADMLNDYFKGHSSPAISDTLKSQGLERHHTSILRTIAKYTKMINTYTMNLPLPNLGDRFHVDEVYVKIDNKTHYLFTIIDYKTRVLLAIELGGKKDEFNATSLFTNAAIRANKIPVEIISDDLDSYKVAFRIVYAQLSPLDDHCEHISDPDKITQLQRQKKTQCIHKDKAGISKTHDKGNNNVIESFNNIQRICYNPRRGIKSTKSTIAMGFSVWYNYVRPHGSLGGTPAEAAGITIHGNNKWITLIGNAGVAAMGGAVA